jgi:type VI protein secretion system component Hcp
MASWQKGARSLLLPLTKGSWRQLASSWLRFSPLRIAHLAHFPQVDLYIRKAGTAPVTGGGTGHSYLLNTFRMVFITTVFWSGGSGQEAPIETVDFVYGALGISYYSQDATGALAPQPETAQWSQVSNMPTLTVPG